MNSEVQRINLDDYIQTGEGGTAVAYTHKNGQRLAKLYNPGFEADRAEAEFLTARTVFELGIPTPEPYRLVTDGERFGGEYELIKNKRSFARIISQEPERLPELAVSFARLSKEFHGRDADTTHLRSYKQVLKRFYQEKNLVTEKFRQAALHFIDQVPDTPKCLHGDLHLGNIITDGERTLWIDLGEASYGMPEWDLGISYHSMHMRSAEMADFLFHMTLEQMANFWDVFFPAYLGTTDPQRIAEATKQFLPFAAAKAPYVYDMAYHKPLPETSLEALIQRFPD